MRKKDKKQFLASTYW